MIKTNPDIIDRILNKGVEQILPSKEALREKLLSKKRLTVYQGFDPTADTLHIGNTVGMRKLEDFRKLGHRVIFLIGDFTARVGDPSDKTATRKMLTEKEVEKNMKKYIEQASHIIDIYNQENPVEIMYNSTWLKGLKFEEIINLASEFTVQQMLKRSMFQKRLEEDKPIHLNEFLYPLMQGYDSVMMNVDIEVGGNDQLFNMLAGREMVYNHLGKEKIVLTSKLLISSDGIKMGKSENNMISLNDKPEDIFGKVMAFSDSLIINSFEILTSASMEEIEQYKSRLEKGENPINLKKELAYQITSEITSPNEAKKAQQYFENIYQNKKDDENIPQKEITIESISLIDLLVESELVKSKAQARRLIEQGAVKINNQKQKNWNSRISLSQNNIFTLKAGRQLCRIIYKK